MIRITRVCFLGKNKFITPIFPQRSVSLSHQILVDLSVTAGNANVRTEEKKADTFISATVPLRSQNSNTGMNFNEIKYLFFKQTLTGFSDKLQQPFDEKTSKDFYEKVCTLTPREIIRVLGLISELGVRPPECLKILCTLLSSYETSVFNASDCANLLYYLAKLSFKDEALVNSICEHLKTLCSELDAFLATNIIHSLSVLKVRNFELLQLLLKQILLKPLVLKNAIKVLHALTVLNYKATDVDDIIQPLSRLEELDFVHSLDYLSFIWSCIILDKYHCISPNHLRKVLSQNYIMRVIKTNTLAPLKWKLLNINAAAQYWSEYNGPVLDGHSSFKALLSSVTRKNGPLLDSVIDTLSHIVPPGNIRSNVNTGTGFILDVEFYTSDSSNKSNSGEKEKKVGIVLLNYNDYCSDGTVTGMTDFKFKTLKQLNYKLLTIPFNEFDISHPLSSKIEVLRSKISAMEEEYKNKELASDKSS